MEYYTYLTKNQQSFNVWIWFDFTDYPDRGYGARVEDTLYVAEDGSLVVLTDRYKELAMPLRTDR